MIVGSHVGSVVSKPLGQQLMALLAATGNFTAAMLAIKFIPSDTKSIRYKYAWSMASMKSRSGSRVGDSGSFLVMISYHNFCPDRNTNFSKIPPYQILRMTEVGYPDKVMSDKELIHLRYRLAHLRDRSNITDTFSLSHLLGFQEILCVFSIPNIRYLLFLKIVSAFPYTLVYSFFSKVKWYTFFLQATISLELLTKFWKMRLKVA